MVAPGWSRSEERQMRFLLAIPILILMKIERMLVLHLAKRRVPR